MKKTISSTTDALICVNRFNERIRTESAPTDYLPFDWYIGTTGEYSYITNDKSSEKYLTLFRNRNVLTTSVN